MSPRVALATAALAVLTVASGCDDGGIAVRGIVVAVQQSSVAHVEGFTLRTDSGQLLQFVVGDLQPGGGSFPAVHLRDHLASAAPIAVRYVVEHGQNIVQRLADAP